MTTRSWRRHLSRLAPRNLVRLLGELESLPELRARNRALGARVKKLISDQRRLEGTLSGVVDELSGLRTRVRQLVAAHDVDEKEAAELTRAATLRQPDRILAHVREAVESSVLDPDPFPHIVGEQLLPDDTYDELVATVPPALFFDHLKVNRQELKVPTDLAPPRSRQAWGFFVTTIVAHALMPAVLEKFDAVLDGFLRQHWPDADAVTTADVSFQIMMSRILLRRPGYEIKPHRDPRWSLLTCLVYLPRRDDALPFGTQLGHLRSEREATSQGPLYVEPAEYQPVKEVPGRPNTALVFLNSTGLHSASIPQDAPPEIRRHLYQLQLGPDWPTQQRLLRSMPKNRARRWKRDKANPGY